MIASNFVKIEIHENHPEKSALALEAVARLLSLKSRDTIQYFQFLEDFKECKGN